MYSEFYHESNRNKLPACNLGYRIQFLTSVGIEVARLLAKLCQCSVTDDGCNISEQFQLHYSKNHSLDETVLCF